MVVPKEEAQAAAEDLVVHRKGKGEDRGVAALVPVAPASVPNAVSNCLMRWVARASKWCVLNAARLWQGIGS